MLSETVNFQGKSDWDTSCMSVGSGASYSDWTRHTRTFPAMCTVLTAMAMVLYTAIAVVCIYNSVLYMSERSGITTLIYNVFSCEYSEYMEVAWLATLSLY